MTPAIILPADRWSVLEAGWLWLRGERVREEVRGATRRLLNFRERLVPPTIPEGLEPTPCGRCDGNGLLVHPTKPVCDRVTACPSCGGSGVVAPSFYVGTEQWRIHGNQLQRWSDWANGEPSAMKYYYPTERRVALLAEARFTGPPIPVVGPDGAVEQSFKLVQLYRHGPPILWTDENDPHPLPEPWAQKLAVGDVLRPVAVDMLDTPITTERWGDPGLPDGHPDKHYIDRPLSLVPGTWGTA